jgi:cephalosporin hydroxylase
MKTLSETYKSKMFDTDKNTLHCYIDHVYSELFSEIQLSAKNVLEIGVDKGGSIFLWKEYFLNADIAGIDIEDKREIFKNNKELKIIKGNAYNKNFIDSIPENYFDLIIDDGPHTLESMISFLDGYQSKLNENGIIVVEDIQEISWIDTLTKHVDKNLIKNIFVHDLRKIKNRYDDILFIIDKRKTND